jgi:hypothetical protein
MEGGCIDSASGSGAEGSEQPAVNAHRCLLRAGSQGQAADDSLLSRAGKSPDLGSVQVSVALEGRRSRDRGLRDTYGASGTAVGAGGDREVCG